MVGDDVTNDVLAAQAIGMTGVLVRTGKFRDADLQRNHGTPDHVIDSFASLPAILGKG
jgi:ribonucleotide monophosphatase NagD (HAD superfamily)